MNPFARWMLLVLLVHPQLSAVGNGLWAGETDQPVRDGASSATQAQSAADVPLEKILERLGRLEKELLELRIKSGKVPADKDEQRILTLLETPFLGSAYYGSNTNPRFMAVKLMLVNLTDQPVTLNRDDVFLSVDGQDYPIKDAPQQIQYNGIQIGQQQVQLRNLQMPKEITLTVGGTNSAWLLFPDLPPGNHVPAMILKLAFGDKTKEIDINAAQRDILGLKIERIGPRGGLGLINVSGVLNTINIASLVEEVDRLVAEKLVRVVICFKDGATIADPQLQNWLHTAVTNLGRQPQFGEAQFPPLPAALREVHLAAVPNAANTGGMQQAYPAFYYPNAGASSAARIHKTEVEAVMAALRTAYESLARDELLQAIQSGNRMERAAALAGGGGRLAADKLPVLLKNADDDDSVIQQAALMALGHFGEPEAIDKLIGYARKDVAALSTTAIASLAGSRYAAAQQAVLELLKNESPESKKSIVKILAAFPRPIWSDAIYEFVKDSRSGLNVEALQALVQVGHPQLIPVLAEALRGTDQNLAQTSLNVLAARTDRESEEIALNYTLEQMRSAPASPIMLQLLNRVKDSRAVPLLTAQFNKYDNKSAVIQTLTLLGDAETAKFLVEKYNNLQSHEKGEVLRSLSRLDKEQFRKLSAQALLTADGSVISYAVQGLQEDGGPEAVKIMTDALENASNNYTWSHLSNALAQAATPAARAALVKARDSENPEKRQYAVSALMQLRQRSPGYQYVYQAQNFSKENKWKEAVEQFDLAIQLDATLSDAYAERGHAQLHLDQPALAAKDFDKALELDPYNSLALTGSCLSMVLSDGKVVEAIKKLEDARARFTRNPMFNYNAACVYGRAVERLKKDEEAPDREKRLAQYQQAALGDLKTAIQTGFQDFELMKADPDLAVFKELAEFQQMLAAPPKADETAVRGVRGKRVVNRPR
ncbi:MAG: hypothetical protein EXS05_03645 [Planctomycetaceae bacterium]|nr:hypothetical protein [Planctomycetaceae bacterium]